MTTLIETPSSLSHGLSAIVPVFNSATMIPQLVARLGPVLQGMGRPFELILVNDGSRDQSWLTILQVSQAHSWIRGICMMRNYGQHNAVLAGIRAARYDTIITLDDDLQHPPEEIPALLANLDDTCDVVYGTPLQQRHGLLRDIASLVTKLALQSAMGARTARMVGAFRVFRTQLRDAFAAYHGPFVNVDVLLTWGTTRFNAVRVRHDDRAEGKSHYTFAMLLRHTLNMMTGFSVLPLQLGSIIGFVFALFGFVVLAYVLARYFVNGNVVAGFPFLASIIAIFSGAQLLSLGIIGEYLARMHFRLMDKPTYTVKDNTSTTTKPQTPA